MRTLVMLLALGGVCGCSNTSVQSQPLSINSPRLDSGERGSAAGGGGADDVVGRRTGTGVINRVTVP